MRGGEARGVCIANGGGNHCCIGKLENEADDDVQCNKVCDVKAKTLLKDPKSKFFSFGVMQRLFFPAQFNG